MIFFVTTATHHYTHRTVERALPNFRRVYYPLLFMRSRLPRGTYIFSDFDRLGFWQLEVAAHLYRVLRDAGCQVLNDPARVLQRLALLRTLHRRGINSFGAWAASDATEVQRFPVFLRTASAHRGNLTDLLPDQAALQAGLEQLTRQGYPLTDLVVIEYRAEPIDDGVFRKHSVYRIGNVMVPSKSVHEQNWTVKDGQAGIISDQAYADDLEDVRTNRYADPMRRAFEVAAVDYGRADFGVVGGHCEVYEINTNPAVTPPSEHSVPARTEAMRLGEAAYLAAMTALDSPSSGPRIAVPPPPSLVSRPKLWRLRGYNWVP